MSYDSFFLGPPERRKNLPIRDMPNYPSCQNHLSIDLSELDRRLDQLDNFDRATSYTKQKDSLKKEFELFWLALPGYTTLTTATPCRFLVCKDRHGLSYKTVDSCIGKFRAIF